MCLDEALAASAIRIGIGTGRSRSILNRGCAEYHTTPRMVLVHLQVLSKTDQISFACHIGYAKRVLSNAITRYVPASQDRA